MTAARNPSLGVSVGTYPSDWVKTPVKGKRPYRDKWQSEEPLDLAFIEQEIKAGRATGLGLRLGPISGGLVAIDLDGPSAAQYLEAQGLALPPTVAWTSGKPGRSQHLYRISEEQWESLDNRRVIPTGTEQEQVEIRGNHHQSVLPPSVHPDTGKPYYWITSPDTIPVAIAPAWVIDKLTRPQKEKQDRKVIEFPVQDISWGDIDRARSYLAALSPHRADNYDEWLAVGMALKSVSDDLLGDWDNWSKLSSKYHPGVCERKWNGFKRDGVGLGTLGQLAKQDGWTSPREAKGTAKRKATKPNTEPPDAQTDKPRVSLNWDEDYTPETLAALEQLNQEYAVIRHNPQGIWDLVAAKPLNVAHFRLVSKNRKGQYWTETNDGKRLESKPLASLWESWSGRRGHDEVDLLPEQPTTDKVLNLWQGWGGKFAHGAIDVPLWTLHLDVLFGLRNWDGSPLSLPPEQRQQRQADRDYFERWLAYPIQNPGAKLRTMALIWSRTQGIGKTTVADLMQGIYGEHFLEVESRFFESGFNGPLVGKLLVCAEEVFCDGRYTFMDRLKSLVTSPRIGINVKHGAQFEAVNRFNLLATSNHPNALHLDDQDRRVFVHEVIAAQPPAGYFQQLYTWGKSQPGKDNLFSHLRTLDLGDFDPYAPARVTEAKLRMIDNSRSDLDRWIAELEYSDLPDVVELKTLLPKARDACPSTRIQSNTLAAALHKAGYEVRRMTKTYRQAYLIAIRNQATYRNAENPYWVNHWQEATVSRVEINSFQDPSEYPSIRVNPSEPPPGVTRLLEYSDPSQEEFKPAPLPSFRPPLSPGTRVVYAGPPEEVGTVVDPAAYGRKRSKGQRLVKLDQYDGGPRWLTVETLTPLEET